MNRTREGDGATLRDGRSFVFTFYDAWIALTLVLLAADAITGLPASLRRALLAVVLPGWLTSRAFAGRSAGRRLAAGVGGLIFGLVLARADPTVASALMTALFVVLRFASPKPGRSLATFDAVLIAASTLSVAQFLYVHVPPLRHVVTVAANLASKELSALLVQTIPSVTHQQVLGPTAFNLFPLLVWLVFGFTFSQFAGKHARARFAVFAVVVFLAQIASMVVARHVRASVHSWWAFHATGQLDMGIVLYPLVSLSLFVLSGIRVSDPGPDVPAPRWSWRHAALALPALALLLPAVPPSGSSRILLLDKKTLDWNVPTYAGFGIAKGGMFGQLPLWLEAMGHASFRGGLTEENLANVDAVVIANLLDPLDRDELERLRSFVRRGGGLILLADHTGGEHIQGPSNEVLEGTAIRVLFDTAVPSRKTWLDCMEFAPHFITSKASSQRDAWIWLGASLSVGDGADPLIYGRQAFSDWGVNVPLRPLSGYIGDLAYHEGETLGDVVLAAAGVLGEGRVVAFGDTSPFQNGAFARSHALVGRVVRWVTWRSDWEWLWDWRLGIAGALFAIAALLCASLPLTGTVAWMGILPLAAFLTPVAADGFEPAARLKGPMVWLDRSHANCVNSLGWHDSAMGGFQFNANRAGYLDSWTDDFDDVGHDERDVFVVVAPLRGFTGQEIDRIDALVRGGGTVILCAGWEDRNGVSALLDRYQMRIEELPLGPLHGEGPLGRPKFYRANRIEATDGGQEARVLCSIGAHPVVLQRRVEKGSVILIGDSCFLLNRNLEDDRDFVVPENVAFLKSLFEMIRGGS